MTADNIALSQKLLVMQNQSNESSSKAITSI